MLLRGGFATYLTHFWESVSERQAKSENVGPATDADHTIEVDN
jgi:hypothetical protein